MSRRALLFVNPASRGGADGDVDRALDCLRAGGIELVEGEGGEPQALCEQIRQQRAEIDCVIIGGGDGSLNAAAPALLDTGLPLGILPLGTANDLARTLLITPDPVAAARIIVAGQQHRIDIATVNDRLFFNVANIGLGAESADALSGDMKKRLGIASYAGSVLKTLRALRRFHADIICDGRARRVHSIQIAIGNGRHFGGGMTIAEAARIDDGVFFLYSVPPLRWWEMLRLLPAARHGSFDERDPLLLERGATVEVRTRRRKRVTADGELLTHTPARFRILPAAITVYVPAQYLAAAPPVAQQQRPPVPR